MTFDQIIVDGNYWARKFFAVHNELCSNVDGNLVYTGLTHGMLLGLCSLKDEYEGTITVVWDRGHDRRKAIDPNYKSNRKKIDDQVDIDRFKDHMRTLKFFLKLIGIRQAYKSGEEGDDIVYTLCEHTEGKKLIVSNDHDFYQALGDGVYQLLSKRDGEILYSTRRLERDTGLTPAMYTHVMSVMGCSGDGVPGIKGIGIKVASDFVKDWPKLVPAILEEDDMSLSEWNPRCTKSNKVIEATEYFEEGEKGPGKKLLDVLGNPWTVRQTNELIRLYDVHPVTFTRNKLDEDQLELQLERCELHECEGRFDILCTLHE